VALDALLAEDGRYGLLAATRDGGPLLMQLRKILKEVDLGELSNCADEIALLTFVADSVGAARYWQDPDETDEILADKAVAEELRPIAEAIRSSPASAWWPSAVALADQVFVDYRPLGSPPPHLAGAQAVRGNWKQRELSNEASRRPGGTWWSPPIWMPLIEKSKRLTEPRPTLSGTTRRLSNLGAVGLLLEEDSYGDAFATCWNVRCREHPRVCEVKGAGEWVELVERYPLDVTRGRRGSWEMATGFDVRWFLPDWSRVVEDFDAVHLSVSGYLTTSGRALSIDTGVSTLVAGWDADKTYWLADMLEVSGSSVEWEGLQHHPPREWRVADPEAECFEETP
jgi:hypothetical protein